MKNRKFTRTCVGCRKKREKKDLIRIVKNKQNEVLVDITQNKSGRGAYICRSQSCFEEAIYRGRFKSALKINLDNKKYEELRGVMFDKNE